MSTLYSEPYLPQCYNISNTAWEWSKTMFPLSNLQKGEELYRLTYVHLYSTLTCFSVTAKVSWITCFCTKWTPIPVNGEICVHLNLTLKVMYNKALGEYQGQQPTLKQTCISIHTKSYTLIDIITANVLDFFQKCRWHLTRNPWKYQKLSNLAMSNRVKK